MSTQVERQALGLGEPMALPPDRRLPWVLPAAIAVAWAIVVAGDATGLRLLDHDVIFEGGRPEGGALGLFLLGWLVMVTAMMLPSSLPAIRDVAARGVGVGPFLGGFAVVWTLFGAAALSLDAVVHRTVDHQQWFEARPYLVTAGLLTAVGLMQVARLKRRCLAACRHWTARPQELCRRRGALVDGARYGQLCVGCDGGLMLLMFAAGGSGLALMMVLSVVMAAERTVWLKGSAHRWIGAAILSSAAVTVASGL